MKRNRLQWLAACLLGLSLSFGLGLGQLKPTTLLPSGPNAIPHSILDPGGSGGDGG